jgi:hypothetical protein
MADDISSGTLLLSDPITSEAELEYHQARVLILLNAFTANRRSTMKGLTKLAKLDFLLRYPHFMEKLLPGGADAWTDQARPVEAEYKAVESRVVRYKYGPWDDRYYPVLGALVGRGLLTYSASDSGMEFGLTEDGRRVASDLAREPAWQVTAARASLLRKYFNYTGNRLKTLIYTTLPDVVDRPWRSEI